MKVFAINGSPRKNGNTSLSIEKVFEALRREGITCEKAELAGKPVRGCTACYGCYRNKNMRCVIEDDPFNELFAKMIEADAVILGSPVYVADVSAEMKGLIDRACLVSRANENPLKRKIGAAVLAVRRAGAIHAFDTINHFFTISEMIVVGSSYWNLAYGREAGEVVKDAEGMGTMTTLGENMAWLLKKVL